MSRVEDDSPAGLQAGSDDAAEHLFYQYSLDLMAIVGRNGFFKKVNPICMRVLGYSEEELLARPVVSFLHPEDVEKTRKGIEVLGTGSERLDSRNRYLCKDGSYRWFSWHTKPVGDDFYTIGRDITAQVESEEKIRDLNQRLEEQNRGLEKKVAERLEELRKSEEQILQLQKMDAIGRLAGGVAHDFNNMLAAILGSCDLMADDISDTAALHEHLHSIRAVTEKATALTRQLLVFSRQQIQSLQSIDLNALVRDLERMLLRLIGENMRIVLQLSDNLKNTRADPHQLEQVILNLVVNARDAMPNGGKITITTGNVYLDEAFTSAHLSVEQGEYVLLTVSDEGTGMSKETIGKIFEPFFTTKAIGKGTGLGLSTTYGIVKKCKGSIWVYSEPGRGTVFKIYLPITEGAAETAAPKPVPVTAVSATKCILLVEDDPSLRNIFGIILARKGYTLFSAENGTDAVEIGKTQAGNIDLLLTDVIMPDCNGFELAARIAEFQPRIKTLFMSGYAGESMREFELVRDKEISFIQKPFNIDTLITHIEQVMQA